jgi:hypothetical protein
MGGVLSSSSVAVSNTETTSKTKESHNESPIINTKSDSQIETAPLTESIESNVKVGTDTKVVETDTKVVETDTKVVEDNSGEIFERYIEPTGTKLEVEPVEVASSVDVVKKNKKKNKKNH